MTAERNSATPPRDRASRKGWLDGILALFLGLSFMAGIVTVIARIESARPTEAPIPMIEDLREVSLPVDPPPPRVVERREVTAEEPLPLTGIEITPSDSPVKIMVAPPDLAELIPVTEMPAVVPLHDSTVYTHFKPSTEKAVDTDRIYQPSEVDKKPVVISRPDPNVPRDVRKGAEVLRVVFLVVIDPRGTVVSVRSFQPSGNAAFDQLIAESIRKEWLFSPAIKNGKNVRCLVQQSVSVRWNNKGSPFVL